MSFAPGQLVGHYEILGPLGAGGMGEVYRARDTRLGRHVALKFLPPLVAADADRLSRFEREAKALAALNHPYIAQIHAIETAGAVHAIVMELVPGQTLAEWMATKGALPLKDAFDIAEQIAQGLEAAHDAGIVHRDLKPGNIKVRPDGTVKVLDFGLAKAGSATAADSESHDPFNSPTIASSAMTVAGVILGTAAYMSPEQARGTLVDKRTDVWAFGCVLYEMLTGRVPFPGETITDVIAAVVKNEPDWSLLPASTPPAIRTLLARCLQKDRRARLRDIGDARLEILDAKGFDSAGPAASAPVPARLIALATATAFVLGAMAATSWRGSTTIHEPTAPWTGVLVGGPPTVFHPRISPDGELLAFETLVDGQMQVAVMKPNAGTWRVITGDRSTGLVYTLNWSPDGSRIFYDRGTDRLAGIYSVPALGGSERLVVADAGFPVALGNGDLLVQRVNANRRQQLHRFSPSTGAVEPLPAFPDTTVSDDSVIASRDGRRVYFYGRRGDDLSLPSAFYRFDFETRSVTPLAPGLPPLRAPVAFALEPGSDNILVGGIDGDAFQILRISAGDHPAIEPVLSVLAPARFDMDRNGNLFLTSRSRPAELYAFPSAVGASPRAPERLVTLPSMYPAEVQMMTPLPDGGLLVASRAGERDRLLVIRAGRDASPLVEGDDETRPPAAPLGPSEAVVTIGPRATPELAIVNTADGRIVRRFKMPSAGMVSMDASVDGRTLYYTAGGLVWSMPLAGGAPTKLGAGDSLTVEHDTGDLIVKLEDGPRVRVMRLKPLTAATEEVAVKGELRLVPQRPLTPGSVRDGKLVQSMVSADSWFWHAATLDLKTGATAKLAAVNPSDIHYATWRADGVPIGFGYGLDTSLWKFTRRK